MGLMLFNVYRLFAWAPDQLRGVRPKHERVVIIRNLFDSTTFEQDVALISEYKQDLREEADKFGAVTKLTIFDVIIHISTSFTPAEKKLGNS